MSETKSQWMQDHQAETDASGYYTGRKLFLLQRNLLPRIPDRPSIGTATVYRMINKLEEIGAINRRNMYKVACDPDCDLQNACTVELDDDTIKHLSAKNWNAVIQAGLKACGYVEDQKVRNITVQS